MKREIDINELKKIEIGLLNELDSYCSAHGLQYFITYGTLIGAARHKGFIPWDDDIDVIMPRKDYEQLIASYNTDNPRGTARILSHKLDSKYYLPIAKLIDTRTVLKEITDIDAEIGVYIDIFPLENLSDNYQDSLKRMRKGFSFNKKLIIKTVSISLDRSRIKNLILRLGKLALKWCSISEIVNRMDEYCKETERSDNTKYVGVICGISAGDASRVFKREWFDSTIELPFEGQNYPAPIGYDALLRQLYGDYMQLPPRNQQISHHAFEAWYKE